MAEDALREALQEIAEWPPETATVPAMRQHAIIALAAAPEDEPMDLNDEARDCVDRLVILTASEAAPLLSDELVRLRHAAACATDFLAWARRFRAGDPSLDPEEWYVESESLANALAALSPDEAAGDG